MSTSTENVLDLTLSDSDDENIPAPSGLTRKNTPSSGSKTTPGVVRKATSTTAKVPKKKAKPTKAFSLIWVCTHGKGRSRTWRQKDLKIVGIYPSKAAAEEAKRDVMSEHDCCGHGDILVGGCWDDEIDLVIREAPLHL